jgi:hypothetical protein
MVPKLGGYRRSRKRLATPPDDWQERAILEYVLSQPHHVEWTKTITAALSGPEIRGYE